MASAVDNLPGLPHETGFAANNTGKVLRISFVEFVIDSIDDSICFHEQSSATTDPPISMILRSSGPWIEPHVGSSSIPLDGERVVSGCNLANPADDISLAVHFLGSSWPR